MFLQAHQESLHLAEVFQSEYLKFLDALDHLWFHSGVENTETSPSASTSQDNSKRCILSGFSEIVASTFEGGNSSSYNRALTEKTKKNWPLLQENQNTQSQQIQDKFAVINLTRVELWDQRKLLPVLDSTLIWIQHIYSDQFTYLEKSGNMML